MTSGVTLRGSADLLAAVPYLLGFHPRDSVVVVAMRRERVLSPAGLTCPGRPMGAMAARFVALLGPRPGGRGGGHRVRPAGRGDAGRRRAAGRAGRFAGLPARRDPGRGGRYWSYVCAEPTCCPPEGHPFDAETSTVALSAVYHGQVALRDREALAAQVAPVGGPVREAMRVATLRADDRLCDLIEAATGGLEVLAAPVAGPDRTRLPPSRHQAVPSGVRPVAVGAASRCRRRGLDASASGADAGVSRARAQRAGGLRRSASTRRCRLGDRAFAGPAAGLSVEHCLGVGRPARWRPRADDTRARRPASSAAAPSPASPADTAADAGPDLARGAAASGADAGSRSAGTGLAPTFDPGTSRRRARRRGAVDPGVVRRARLAKAMLTAGRAAVANAFDRYRDGGVLSDDEVAWLSVLLSAHLPVRDLAWEQTTDEEWHVALWTDVLQRVEPDLAAGPASLLAFAAWRCGNGALAGVAVERALAISRRARWPA